MSSGYEFFGAYLPPYAKRFLDRLEEAGVRFEIEADESAVQDLAPSAFPEPFSAGTMASGGKGTRPAQTSPQKKTSRPSSRIAAALA